jgi:cytochrome c oxidase subunit 3
MSIKTSKIEERRIDYDSLSSAEKDGLETELTSKIKLERARDTLLMIGIFSIVMLFAGFTSAYIVQKKGLGNQWDLIPLPDMFYVSTFLILISSLFGYFSINYCKSDNFKMLTRCLLCTIILGLSFSIFQFLGYSSLYDAGKVFSGNNHASSYIYVLTGIHLVHLFGGLISLIFIFFRSLKKNYNSSNLHGLKLGIRFWHFLAILWIYLFLFLMLIN